MSKKRIIRLAILFAILAILIYALPLQINIDKTISGLQWIDGDNSYLETVDIKIKGTYKMYLIKNNIFKGYITLSNNNETRVKNSRMFDLELYKSRSNSGFLAYSSKGNSGHIVVGWISVKGVFDKLSIRLDETDNGYISAPATDRKAALDIAFETNYEANNDLS
jgi:hypothetical protein